MEKIFFSVARDYTEYPALRHSTLSEYSGEDFYHSKLNHLFYEALKSEKILVIDLDNTAGYATSFLDEAFGNLVFDFTVEKVRKHLLIISNQEPHWKEMIEKQTFNEWEKRRMQGNNPIVTIEHDDWYRFDGINLEKRKWETPSSL